jgi:hypothetical protein
VDGAFGKCDLTVLGFHDRDQAETNRKVSVNNVKNSTCKEVKAAGLGQIKRDDDVEQVKLDTGELTGIHRLEEL